MTAPANATPQIWTVRTLLAWTSDFLHKKGVEAAPREARILLGHVLQCTPIEVVTRYDEEPNEAIRTAFRELIRRRVEGWPVAYLVGKKDFYLLTFDVTPAVLIPRPDTETLVQFAVDFLKNKPNANVLDLGTGSGCIAVSLAHQCKAIRVTAVDISPDAATVAGQNAVKHGVQDRVTIRTGDLFAALPAGSEFDLIVSNPPYIAPAEIETLAKDVKDHEPRVALDGGPDGLAFYRRITADAGKYLKAGGALAVEIGYQQETAVRELFEKQGEWILIPTLFDMGGRPRVIAAKKK